MISILLASSDINIRYLIFDTHTLNSGEPSLSDQHHQGCYHLFKNPILAHSSATAGEYYYTPLEASARTIQAERPSKGSFTIIYRIN